MKIEALGREWGWPDSDFECRRVVFDWARDLGLVYPYCRSFRTAIQAGGNMGVWPWLLAKKFVRVITAEPEPECLRYLRENVPQRNVEILSVALGSAPSRCSIQYEMGNLGAQFVVPGTDFEVVTVDSLGVADCDLIYLDIEGAEMDALRGAVETIRKSWPVVVVEDKKLSERFGYQKGDIEKWLAKDFGYRVAARPHRDVVLVHA